METAMFCRQCEQAARGVACDVMGNCGKNPEVSALLDLMVHGLKGVAVYAHQARELGAKDPEIDRFMLSGLFSRVTNVNFDPNDIAARLQKCYTMKERARGMFERAHKERKGEPAPEFDAGPEALEARRRHRRIDRAGAAIWCADLASGSGRALNHRNSDLRSDGDGGFRVARFGDRERR